jgi:4'-phosphopantetheinyl transferase EntD
LVEEVLPPSVIAVETREDRLDVELFPEEELALGRAVDKRRREFVTGRACAREALARLGLPPTAVGSGRHGEPLWPAGIVGSITHCDGYRACAVASAHTLLTLGIDAERHAPLSDGVWQEVAHGQERALRVRNGVAARAGVHLDAVLFSAKEAVYKAWFPLARRWLDFDDVELSIHAGNGTFRATLLVTGPQVAGAPLTELAGRWTVGGGVVVTAVAVPAAGERGGPALPHRRVTASWGDRRPNRPPGRP